jgi:hypothetical protein
MESVRQWKRLDEHDFPLDHVPVYQMDKDSELLEAENADEILLEASSDAIESLASKESDFDEEDQIIWTDLLLETCFEEEKSDLGSEDLYEDITVSSSHIEDLPPNDLKRKFDILNHKDDESIEHELQSTSTDIEEQEFLSEMYRQLEEDQS